MQANYEKFEIKAVELTKSKAGDNYVVVKGIPEVHKKYVSDWIREGAYSEDIERWWRACGLVETEWSDYFSESAFSLVGQTVLVKLIDDKNKDRNGNYYKKIDEVHSLDYVEKTQEKPAKTDAPKPMKPVEDDLPF